MILAPISEYDRYCQNPLLQLGFNFLQEGALSKLGDGKHVIHGDEVFAVVARGIGRGQSDSRLEFHRSYLDIQYVVSGVDLIGWRPTPECRTPHGTFDDAKDLGLFEDRPKLWMPVSAGEFAIFYPEDAHAPLGGSGPVHKVIVKVALTK